MKTILDSTLEPVTHVDSVKPRSKEDDQLFSELANVLKRHGALDRFGVTLLHEHFELKPGEVLLETTDIQNRDQRLRPIDASTIDQSDVLETSWRLSDEYIAMRCICVKLPDGNHSHQSRG